MRRPQAFRLGQQPRLLHVGCELGPLDREADLVDYADWKQFPIIPCTLCGSQENLQRKQVGRMMAEWEREHPGRIDTIAKALCDVRPSQLADPSLFDFLALGRRTDAPLPTAHAWLTGEDLGTDEIND